MFSPNCATGETDQNLGSFKLSTISPFEVYLATTNGLFNRDSKVHLDFKLQNASISYGQNNQDLTLKDFNFNLSADGYLYIDETEGVVLTSKGSVGDNIVVLGRVEDKTDVHDSRVGNATNPGLNVDLRYGSVNSTHRICQASQIHRCPLWPLVLSTLHQKQKKQRVRGLIFSFLCPCSFCCLTGVHTHAKY